MRVVLRRLGRSADLKLRAVGNAPPAHGFTEQSGAGSGQ
jgi:hypothetical protein